MFSITELIFPPAYTLKHTWRWLQIPEEFQKWSLCVKRKQVSPLADNTSRWGTPWSAARLSNARYEWCQLWPVPALPHSWVCEWRWKLPLWLVIRPPVTEKKNIIKLKIWLFFLFFIFFVSLTSLVSALVLNGGLSSSSCSLSNWISRWGRRGEPSRAWQKMAFTGEDLNLTEQC